MWLNIVNMQVSMLQSVSDAMISGILTRVNRRM